MVVASRPLARKAAVVAGVAGGRCQLSAPWAPWPDLGAAIEHRDDHDVGYSDRPDQQGDLVKAQEKGIERACGIGLR